MNRNDTRNSSRVIWKRRGFGVLALLAVFMVAAFLGHRVSAQMDQEALTQYKFTFARIRYATPYFDTGRRGRFEPPWSHDYPRAHQHLMKIVSEVTKIDVNPEGHIVTFENEEVFKYPIAYICEVGFLDLSDIEAKNMNQYLLRGGFLIVDDFRGDWELDNFKRQMRKVFPDRPLEPVPREHSIFNCFYDIRDIFPMAYRMPAEYLGISDDKGRLMMIVDYNNDLSEFWEWSDNPFMPIQDTNDAYKYGVNYIVYALTH